MTITFDAAINTVTIVLTDAEKAILQRAIQQYGAATIRDMFASWLADRKIKFAEMDGEYFQTHFELLSTGDQDLIRAKLASVTT